MSNRWIFTDTVTAETYSMPINPDSMTSPEPERQLRFGGGYRKNSRVRTYENAPDAKEWSFGGVIRNQAQHDALHRWAVKDVPVEVTDHLGRTFRVVITTFDVTDRRPTATVTWRMRYQMTTRIVRRTDEGDH